MAPGARSSRPKGFSWLPVSVPAGQAGSGSRQATSRIPTPIKYQVPQPGSAERRRPRARPPEGESPSHCPENCSFGVKGADFGNPAPHAACQRRRHCCGSGTAADTAPVGGHGRRDQWEAPHCRARPIGSCARRPVGRAAPHVVTGLHVSGGHGGERRRVGAGGDGRG